MWFDVPAGWTFCISSGNKYIFKSKIYKELYGPGMDLGVDWVASYPNLEKQKEKKNEKRL